MGVGTPAGSVVIANVPDPRGENRKDRPIVLLDDIHVGDTDFFYVAITTQLPKPLTDDYVILPFHQTRGLGATGLTQKCAALCTWYGIAPLDDFRHRIGRLSSKDFDRILSRLAAIRPDLFDEE